MTIHPTDLYAGQQLRKRRQEIGVSQTELGRASDITFQQVQKYETGANRMSASRLKEFADFLKVPVGYFFGEGCERVERRINERRIGDRRHV